MFDTFALDLWYAARRLRGAPGFTLVAILTLALGIGAVTAIFSTANPLLFEPLPYPNPGGLTGLWYSGTGGALAMQSFGNYRELNVRNQTFDAMAVYGPWQPAVSGDGAPERLDGQRVSASYFRTLGVVPAVGRDFDPADDRLRGPHVVIIGDRLWHRRFGADPAIVGQQIRLSDVAFTVAGVMPPAFENVLAPSSEIWTLLQFDASLPADGREWGHNLHAIGRLRSTATIEQARVDLDAIAKTPIAEFSRPVYSNMSRGVIVTPLRDDLVRDVKPALMAVIGAVLLLLAVACVNVTNLLLARGVQRRGEFAVRSALGASRSRLIRQLLAESLLLALAGAALGVVMADAGVSALVALSPPGLPRAGAIGLDGPVLLFALALTTIVGVGVGLLPALRVSRGGDAGLQANLRTATAAHERTRRALVVLQVALAVVLLVSAGLLLRSVNRLFGIEPGFDASRVLTMQLQASSAQRFPTDAALHRFFTDSLQAIRNVPGVTSAAMTAELPLSGDDAANDVYKGQFESGAGAAPRETAIFRYAVTPGYFDTMGIPLRRGRLFDDRDVEGASMRPVVISESFARHWFAAENPIGRRIRFAGPPDRPWDVIVGVAGDVKQTSLGAVDDDAVYVSTAQWLWVDNPLWVVIKTRGDAAAMAPAIRQAIWSIDKDQPIVRVRTMDDVVARSEARRRFTLTIFEAFGLTTLALAAIGLYGLLAGSVTERAREIGIRAALGASGRQIVGAIVRQGMTLTAAGTAIGLLSAAVASRAIASLLFGVSRLDLATYASVAGVLSLVAVVACWAPAWRAARVDPSITLRAE